jgi:predicted DCC family thiol-disulfide oxidoreductase YuxK
MLSNFDQMQPDSPSSPTHVLLFDGDCVMCNSTVHFVANRDAHQHISFASLQSRYAESVLAAYPSLPRDLSSVVLLDLHAKQVHTKSDAALRTAALLSWPVSWLQVFLCVPRVVRDAVYDFVARNRYRWFGKMRGTGDDAPDACPFNPAIRERTLDTFLYFHQP